MSLLCQLQNIHLSFGAKALFQDAKFFLRAKEKVGLLGLNGMGKSSLLKILSGDLIPDQAKPPFVFDRAQSLQEGFAFSALLVPQDLPLISTTAGDYWLEFYPLLKKYKEEGDWEKWEQAGGWKIEKDFQGQATQVGFTDLDKNFLDLSGGEQRKLGLALGLSCPYSLILWDEPTNHLDIQSIEKFEEAMEGSQKAHLIVSHDRYLLSNVCSRILHIQRGEIQSFEGNYYAYLRYLKQKEEDRLKEQEKLANIHRRETAWVRRGARARTTKSKSRLESYEQLNKRLHDLHSQQRKVVSFNLTSSGRETKVLFEAQDLSIKFGSRTLFSGLNFFVPNKKKIALIGKNGVGKSTLVKILLGEQEATSGIIKKADQLQVGYFSQKRDHLPMDQKAIDFISHGEQYITTSNGLKRHIYSYLEDFLFAADQLDRPLKSFSGGELNRLRLAKFMKHPADIWIFDEPTNDLDLETVGILEDEMDKFPGAVLFISHDRAFIDDLADQSWLIEDGKLIAFEGGYQQVESYLEEKEIELKLQSMKKPADVAKDKEGPKGKASNHQKQRWKVIEEEIQKTEQLLAIKTEEMANFDFAQAGAQKMTELQNTLGHVQTTLDKLYAEWAELENLFS